MYPDFSLLTEAVHLEVAFSLSRGILAYFKRFTCLNSRPLAILSSDSNNVDPLTTSHLLIGDSSIDIGYLR